MKLTALALLTTISLNGCATAEKKALDAATKIGENEARKKLPKQPADCRRAEHSGVVEGERQDVALIKTDQALGRQNARLRRCAQWYTTIRNNNNK